MRKRIGWLLLLVGLLGAPGGAFGQPGEYTYEVPPVAFTGPLSHPRYETGGAYAFAEALYFRQTRPLQNQVVAVRGFVDVDGSITGTPATFVGSGEPALNTNQLRGPGSWQPGTNFGMGWRFESGVTIEASWLHLVESRYAATAAILSPTFNVGKGLENTFLFAPVTNFTNDFGGNPNNLAVGNPNATYGIWNGASLMQIQYIQRFDQGQLSMRTPIWDTASYRSYALIGPRLATFYDQFKWRTVDYDQNGNATADTSANYTNTVSNRLYGVHFGCGNDWFLGDTPIGGFAIRAEFETGLYLDRVKGRPKYELGDRSIAMSRAQNLISLVPALEARVNADWYPYEAVKVSVGYNFLSYFNTVASPQPIDFNAGTLNPQYDHGITRYFQGISIGLGLVF